MSQRKRIDSDTEALVLSKCARRCCICLYLNQDLDIKQGQIAHLDQDPSNASETNLAFLCLDHHSQYDSRTSQHKNFTLKEVLLARDVLHARMERFRNDPQPPTSLQQSGGVSFGPAAEVKIFGDVIGGNANSRGRTRLERGEELYNLIDQWLLGFATNYLRLSRVMQGKLTWNQHNDLTIAQGSPKFDFTRIKLLIDLYFTELQAPYPALIEARTRLNAITIAYRKSYDEGDFDGTQFLAPFVAAQRALEANGEDLKSKLVAVLRGNP